MEITDDNFIDLLSGDFPNFKVNKSNLSYPTSDFVISYYTMMLEAVINMNDTPQVWAITEEQNAFISSYQPEGASFFQHLAYYNLYVTVKHIFSEINPSLKFLYCDLIMPENTPRRTLVFMHLMLNYYFFLMQLGDDLNDGMTACEQKSEERKALTEERDRLIQQLAQNEDEKVQCIENLREIRLSIDKFNILNEEKQNIVKDLHTLNESVAADLMKIEENEQNLQDMLTKMENEKKYYESLIVSDQNQVIDIHSKFVSKKDECVKKLKSLNEKADETKKKSSQLNKVMELQQKINNILRDEKFLADAQTKHMDFKYLHDSIKNLKEAISGIKDDDLVLRNKINESEEVVLKLKNEYVEYESQQASITCKGKERTGTYNEYIETQKKSSSQVNSKIVKESPEMENIRFLLGDLEKECNKIVEKIKELDKDTATKYAELEKEMNDALSTVTAIAE